MVTVFSHKFYLCGEIEVQGEEDASQRSRIAQQRPEEFAETLVQELAKGADLWKVEYTNPNQAKSGS